MASVYKNIAYSLLTKGMVALFNFLILIISSRYLGVNSRGEISLFVLNLFIIQLINEIYTGYSIIHFIPLFSFKKLIANGVFFTIMITSLSNSIIVFIEKQVEGYELLGFAISVLIILNTFNCVLLLGKQQLRFYNFLSFLQPFLLLVGLLVNILLIKNYKFSAFIYPLFLSFFAAFMISSFLVWRISRKEPERDKFQMLSIVVNGFYYQLSSVLFILVNRFSFYVFNDKTSVGLYSSASNLVESVLLVANAILPVLLSRVANMGNTKESSRLALLLVKISALCSALGLIGVYFIPESFMTFVLGNGFVGIKMLMLAYSPGVWLASIFLVFAGYFSAIGKLKSVVFCYLLGACISLCFTPAFIDNFGMLGAAYSANISYFVMMTGLLVVFLRQSNLGIKEWLNWREDVRLLKSIIRVKKE